MKENFKLYNLEMKTHSVYNILDCNIRAIRNYWILLNNISEGNQSINGSSCIVPSSYYVTDC